MYFLLVNKLETDIITIDCYDVKIITQSLYLYCTFSPWGYFFSLRRTWGGSRDERWFTGSKENKTFTSCNYPAFIVRSTSRMVKAVHFKLFSALWWLWGQWNTSSDLQHKEWRRDTRHRGTHHNGGGSVFHLNSGSKLNYNFTSI